MPTAMHADGPVHDTACNVESVPATPTGTLDHVDPFHASLPASSFAATPTARHADGPVQDTAFIPSDVGLGSIDHVDPFHDSFTVPTAAQNVEPTHDTPLRALFTVDEIAGEASTDQETPGLACAPAGTLAAITGMVAAKHAGTRSLTDTRFSFRSPLG